MPHIYGVSADDRFVALAAKVAADVIAPTAADVDEKSRFPKESLAALAANGFFGLCLPEAVGGAGRGPRTFVAVVEEIAAACGSTAMIYLMHNTAAQAIASSASLAGKS